MLPKERMKIRVSAKGHSTLFPTLMEFMPLYRTFHEITVYRYTNPQACAKRNTSITLYINCIFFRSQILSLTNSFIIQSFIQSFFPFLFLSFFLADVNRFSILSCVCSMCSSIHSFVHSWLWSCNYESSQVLLATHKKTNNDAQAKAIILIFLNSVNSMRNNTRNINIVFNPCEDYETDLTIMKYWYCQLIYRRIMESNGRTKLK